MQISHINVYIAETVSKKSCGRDPKSSRLKFILKNTQGKINDTIRFFGLLFPQLPTIFLHTSFQSLIFMYLV